MILEKKQQGFFFLIMFFPHQLYTRPFRKTGWLEPYLDKPTAEQVLQRCRESRPDSP